MKLEQNIELEQVQVIGQNQIQSLEILSMNNEELNTFIQNEYFENPILEFSEGNSKNQDSIRMKSFYHESTISKYHREVSKESRIMEHNDFEKINFREDIFSQLNMNQYSFKEVKLLEFLIESLDENGFLYITNEEIARINKVDINLVDKCLANLQELEPHGIFARNLEESLLLQIKALDLNEDILIQIIKKYLKDIASGKVCSISRDLEISTAQVRKYISIIGTLNPRPLGGFREEKMNYIIPDIIASYQDKEWSIELNDNWIGNYGLCDYYISMMQNTIDRDLFTYFENKLKRAQFVINCIEQRRKTILGISNAIIDYQEEFFLKGKLPKPMTMGDIAEKINIHTSTVSRGIKGKYLQYPRGTVLLKNLFAGNVSNNKSSIEIKKILKEIIKHEDKKKPYSDEKIVHILKEKNILISRRAVAKYREELMIPGSYNRKER